MSFISPPTGDVVALVVWTERAVDYRNREFSVFDVTHTKQIPPACDESVPLDGPNSVGVFGLMRGTSLYPGAGIRQHSLVVYYVISGLVLFH